MADVEIVFSEDFLSFPDKLKKADKLAPHKIYEGLNKLGNQTKKELKENTPVGKSQGRKKKRLKDRWRKSHVTKEYGNYVTKIRSTAPHYHLVERGHRIVPRGGKSTGKASYKRQSTGHVPGQFFAQKVLDRKESEIYRGYEKILDDIIEEFDK